MRITDTATSGTRTPSSTAWTSSGTPTPTATAWGDFLGLSRKVDYLADLGVTCIWLMPFYPSPLQDDGYDIADFYDGRPAAGHASATSSTSCAPRTTAASG